MPIPRRNVIVVPADDRVAVYYHRIEVLDGGLAGLQALVGGYIEALPYPPRPGAWVCINEEGKIHGLPGNVRATHLLRRKLHIGDWIAGPAVICGGEVDGEMTDVPFSIESFLRDVAAEKLVDPDDVDYPFRGPAIPEEA
jgi:hypothetical protein